MNSSIRMVHCGKKFIRDLILKAKEKSDGVASLELQNFFYDGQNVTVSLVVHLEKKEAEQDGFGALARDNPASVQVDTV